VLVGRFLWRAFADDLGVVPDLGDAWVPVLVTLGAGLVLAGIAAIVPAWLAARATPAPALRTE
jgi:ABC-type lipoprotein release transport system permease subunit